MVIWELQEKRPDGSTFTTLYKTRAGGLRRMDTEKYCAEKDGKRTSQIAVGKQGTMMLLVWESGDPDGSTAYWLSRAIVID
jgi:hypothetical protein